MHEKSISRMVENANSDAWLTQRGRFVNLTFMLESGEDAWLVTIIEGRVAHVIKGPFVMPRWTFALRAAPETWVRFCLPSPAPGFHDLMAMVKYRTLRLEGDQHPFMANLLYFKDLLAGLRLNEETIR
jgi:hypothetical protein